MISDHSSKSANGPKESLTASNGISNPGCLEANTESDKMIESMPFTVFNADNDSDVQVETVQQESNIA